MFLSDTTPEAEEVLIQLLRDAPSWRKFHMVGELNAAVKWLMVQGLRQRHPEASDAQIKRLLADLILGEELAEKVYGAKHL